MITKMKIAISLFFLIVTSVTFSQTGSIEGIINDAEGPVYDARVELKETTFKAKTDFDGVFKFKKVPVGNYELLVTAMGMEPYSEKVTIEDGKTLKLKNIKLQVEKSVQEIGEVTITKKQQDSDSKANRLQKMDRAIGNVEYVGDGEQVAYNAADNLQKMPAVTVRKDQGEGRYMSVRGTPTNWNSSLINGDRLPVADEESETRTMAFDVLSSDLLDYIRVAKALTPDMEGDAIGGAVNFITKTSPDSTEIRINLMGGYNAQAQKPIYNGNIFFGTRSKNDKFGFLINASAYVRNYGTDNFEVVYGSNYNHGLNRLELRDYTGLRSTYSGNFAFDYKFAENKKLYFKGMAGFFSDNEFNMKTRYNYAIGAGSTIMLQHIHSKAQSLLYGGEIGGEFQLNPKWGIDFKYAFYSNQFQFGPTPFKGKDDRNGYFVMNFEKFNVKFQDQIYLDKFGGSYSIDANGNPINDDGTVVTDPSLELARVKLIGKDNPRGGDDWNNIQPIIQGDNSIDDYEFSGAYSELNTTWERDPIIARFNVSFEPKKGQKWKAGVKVRHKQGYRSLSKFDWHQNFNTYTDQIKITSYNPVDLNLNGGFMQELGQPWEGTFLPFLDPEKIDGMIENLGDTLREDPMTVAHEDYYEFVGSTYSYEESVEAGFLMLDYQINKKWSIIGGVRVEATQLKMQGDTILDGDDDWFLAHIYDVPDVGYEVVDINDDPYENSGYEKVKEYTVGYPVKKSNLRTSYISVLPMFHVRWDPDKYTVVRGAITRTFRRPNFIEMKPGSPIINFTNLEFNQGNRDLKPSYAWNLDLSYERYMKGAGLISVGLFGKRIDDHIYRTITADVDPQLGIIYKSYQNADRPIYLFGVEVNFKKKFDFFKNWTKGFGVDANFSYTYSRMRIPGRSFSQALPMQPPMLFNAGLFYENDKFKIRVATNYTDGYLLEVNTSAVVGPSGELNLLHDDTDYDVFLRHRWDMNVSGSFKFTKNIQMYAEVSNLLNTPFYIFRGQEYRPMQVEYYSIRATLGLKFLF